MEKKRSGSNLHFTEQLIGTIPPLRCADFACSTAAAAIEILENQIEPAIGR
jgi:hypothetical protein